MALVKFALEIALIRGPREVDASEGRDQERYKLPWQGQKYHGARLPPKSPPSLTRLK